MQWLEIGALIMVILLAAYWGVLTRAFRRAISRDEERDREAREEQYKYRCRTGASVWNGDTGASSVAR